MKLKRRGRPAGTIRLRYKTARLTGTPRIPFGHVVGSIMDDDPLNWLPPAIGLILCFMLVEKRIHDPAPRSVPTSSPSLADKIEFLQCGYAYRPPVSEVTWHETHMSQVFLAGNRAYKLKKPVRFPYLDFSTLARREAGCRAELRLNRRLAPDVYRDVVPLVHSATGLSIGGSGDIVDWLVVMDRLDERLMLDRVIAEGRLHRWHLDRLAAVLIQFYRRTSAVLVSPAVQAADFWRNLAYNRRILLDARYRLPSGLVHYVDAVRRRFLAERAKDLANACGRGASSMATAICAPSTSVSVIRSASSTAWNSMRA